MSSQFRTIEGRVKSQRDAVEAARKVASEAIEKARLAQLAMEEANQKVASCEQKLCELEAEERQLLRQPPTQTDVMEPATVSGPDAPLCVEALIAEMGDDAEGLAALEVIRGRLAARTPVPVELEASYAPAPSGTCPVEALFCGRGSARTVPY